MIYYSAASSSLKKKTDLKGILSHGLCFSVERRVIFPLRNVKCKDYISCQFVETTHLKLICIRRMKSRSSSTRKRPKEKRLLIFFQMFSNVQHLKGLMTFIDNQKRLSCGNQSIKCGPLQFPLCCQNGEFWNINGTLHGTQRRVPTNFIALRSRLVLVLLIYHRP